jgi:hypothetical protein
MRWEAYMALLAWNEEIVARAARAVNGAEDDLSLEFIVVRW